MKIFNLLIRAISNSYDLEQNHRVLADAGLSGRQGRELTVEAIFRAGRN